MKSSTNWGGTRTSCQGSWLMSHMLTVLHQVICQTVSDRLRCNSLNQTIHPCSPWFHSSTIFFDSKNLSKLNIVDLALLHETLDSSRKTQEEGLDRSSVAVTQGTIFINIPTEPFIAFPRINIVQVAFYLFIWFCGSDTKIHIWKFVSAVQIEIYKNNNLWFDVLHWEKKKKKLFMLLNSILVFGTES